MAEVTEVKNNKRPFSIKKLFVDKDVKEWIYFLREVSPATLKGEFAKYGAEIDTDQDVEALISMYESGSDRKGVYKNASNRILVFDTASVIKSIDVPKADLNTKGSNINWIA